MTMTQRPELGAALSSLAEATLLSAFLFGTILCGAAPAVRLHVSPSGDDSGTGAADSPFRTVHCAQQAARKAAETAVGDVVVELAPGVYSLEEPLKLTNADSGRNGNTVVYRSAGGLGKTRLLGSRLLQGWQEHEDGIWKIELPEKTLFHTLYENGKRAHKARFPNYEHQARFPSARGRYLLSQDGSPVPKTTEPRDKTKEPSWLTYAPEDAPPATSGPKMKILLFGGGKCDWMRVVSPVVSIDPEARRILVSRQWRGIGVNARFFLEDAMGFLDAPGEFYVDETVHRLYYKPMGEGHPDTLDIRMPVLSRLVEIQGESREACAANLRLEGLALEETDGAPRGWWSTRYGLTDGALVWLGNATNVEIRECHLKNGGRSGVVMAGHSVGNRVVGCWIQNMGVNGVTLSNRWHNRKEVPPILDRCEHNRVHNCRIHDVGEIHTYASCINVFNVSHNEISHCELYDSVRYAVTVRGNTGQQYGPPTNLDYEPPCTDNHMHHLRIFRCGQDGGDMGALHCANVNNPDGGFVNTFEQITVADSAAVPSMRDVGPDGIFLDWPRMSMDQIFRNVHIVRSQGMQIRSNGSDNARSAQTTNVSWEPDFKTGLMDYANIGLTARFPVAYGGPPAAASTELPPPPSDLTGTSTACDRITLSWTPSVYPFRDSAWYTVFRDGQEIALVQETTFTDARLEERTTHSYEVAARDGDFCHWGAKTQVCTVQTLPDLTRPTVEHAWSTGDGTHLRVLFSKAMSREAACHPTNYTLGPGVEIESARMIAPSCVELSVDTFPTHYPCRLTVTGLTDTTPAQNPLAGGSGIPVVTDQQGVWFPMLLTEEEELLDCMGSGGDARLHDGATVQPRAGPFGGPALVLDGTSGYAEASPDFNLGSGDFTIMLWLLKENASGHIVLSKGNGFGSDHEWSFGWPNPTGSVCLRLKNVFHGAAAGAVPTGKWNHVAFVRRGNLGFTYVNGEPSGGPHDLSDVGDLSNEHPLRIGRRAHEPDPNYWRGKVAQVKILDHALSVGRIRAEAREPAEKAGDTSSAKTAYHPTTPDTAYTCLFNHGLLIASDAANNSRERFGSYIARLEYTDVDAVLCCPQMWRTNLFPSKVDLTWKAYKPGQKVSTFKAWDGMMTYLHSGGDPVMDTLEACRQYGKGFFISYRMNDQQHTEDLKWPCHNDFWRDHPEYWLGRDADARLHNYMLSDVRDHYFAVIEELCTTYDVDGFELDFQRYPRFFRTAEVGEGTTVMTAFVKRIRNMLDRLGKERGKTLKLCVRVPHTVAAGMEVGLDVVGWDAAELIDMITVSSSKIQTVELDIEAFKTRTKGARIYGEMHYITHGKSKEKPGNRYTTREIYRGTALNLLARGVDGLSLYNVDYVPEHKRQDMAKVLEGITQRAYLRTFSKDYAIYPGFGSFEATDRQTVELIIPDDTSEVAFDRSVLRIETVATCVDLRIGVWLNGKQLAACEHEGTELFPPVSVNAGYPSRDQVAFYAVPLDLLVPGKNTINIENLDSEKRSCELFSLEIGLYR